MRRSYARNSTGIPFSEGRIVEKAARKQGDFRHSYPQWKTKALLPLLDLDELVVVRTEADLLAVLDHRAPVGVGMRHVEVVVRAVLGHATSGVELIAHLGELSVGHGGHLERRIDAGLVDRHGIEAREHTDIGHDGRIVLGMTVAVGADVDGERNVEARTILHDSLRVLGNLAVEHIGGRIAIGTNRILIAYADAAAAAHAASPPPCRS